VRLAVDLAADDKLMQMGVGPAHRFLDDLMQLEKGDV
jgi:hypothetical protein